MPTLAERIRAKYPGHYDDMDDATLESAVLAKHPEYKDLATQPEEPSADTILQQAKSPIAPIDTTSSPSAPKPGDEGLLSKVWHGATSPLYEGPSRFAQKVSKYINPERTTQGVRGIGSAYIESLGNAVSGFTSPLNLALMATGIGEGAVAARGLPQVARLFGAGTKALSAPVVAHGAYELGNPSSSFEERLQALPELAMGILGMRSRAPGVLPKEEPTISESAPIRDIPINPQLENIQRNAPFGEGSILPSEVLPTELRGEGIPPSEEFTPMKFREDLMPPPSPDLTPVGEENAYNSMFAPEQRVSAEEQLFNQARNKFNMGRDLPSDMPPPDESLTPTRKGPQLARLVDEGGTIQLGFHEPVTEQQIQTMFPEQNISIQKIKGSPIFEGIRKNNEFYKVNFWTDDGRLDYNASKQAINDLGGHLYEARPTEPNTFTPNEIKGSTINEPESTVNDIFSKRPETGGMRFNPRGQKGMTGSGETINVSSPEEMRSASMQGFEVTGKNADGTFEMTNTGGSGNGGGKPPILESDIPSGKFPGQKVDVRKTSTLQEALNLPRGIMASWDLSAPFRQGLGLIHKGAWWTSWNDMVRSFGSEKAFQASQRAISERPLFRPNGENPSFAEQAGLKLTDLTSLSSREEQIMSTWAEKIPGVRASNRAYTAFLNNLRADVFEDLVNNGKVFGANSEVNIPLAKELAEFVNTATGRGSLGKLEKSASALNTAFFSPRLIASRLGMMTKGAGAVFSPETYMLSNPSVRREYLKSLFSVAVAGNIVGQLGRMAGGKVEKDPTSADFGKVKFKNGVRIDPFGGFQQYIVLANRLLQNRTKSSVTGRDYTLGEKFGRPTRFDVLERFGESKLNPVLSFATGFLHGKDFQGQPFDMKQELASRFIPIFMQDVQQLMTEDPKLFNLPEHGMNAMQGRPNQFHPQNAPFMIPSLVGMGVQQY